MRCDDDHRVFFFIEQDRLHRSWHLTDLAAVFKVVSETDAARLAAEEEKAVYIVANSRSCLVEDKAAENDLADSTFARILADGCQSAVGSPYCAHSLHATCYHATTVCREGNVGNRRLVYSFVVSCEALIFIPKKQRTVRVSDCKGLDRWMPL